jgi:hypothetical protein
VTAEVSFAEPAAETDLERLYRENAEMRALIARQTEAINLLGANVQWIVENVQGIFKMFGSPQFAAMLPQMAAGAMGGMPDGR